MGLECKKILGINVTIASEQKILEEVRKYLEKVKSQKSKVKSKKEKPLVIYTPNPEIIMYAQKDHLFKRIVNSARISIPDGVGVSLAVKKLFGREIRRISGTDLMIKLSETASLNGLRVGLIGGRRGVALKTLECLQRKYPKLKGWAVDGPEIKISNIKYQKSKIQIKNQKEKYFSSLVDEIKKRQIDILFVALGFPKQEYFIAQLARTKNKEQRTKNKKVLSSQFSVQSSTPLVLMAVGGAFDYISGRIPRAPVWMQEAGFEWLYRLIREPWRLSRQISGAEFFFRILTS